MNIQLFRGSTLSSSPVLTLVENLHIPIPTKQKIIYDVRAQIPQKYDPLSGKKLEIYLVKR